MARQSGWFSHNRGCSSRQNLTPVWQRLKTTTTTSMMLVVLSSSFVGASRDVAEEWTRLSAISDSATSPVTRVDVNPANTTATTPPVGVQRPAASPLFPASTTVASFLPTEVRDRLRPSTATDRLNYNNRDAERRVSRTTSPPDDSGDDFRRRRFHLISAAQSSSGTAVRRLPSRKPPSGPSVTTRLLYGAIALVVATIVTPIICLAGGLVRSTVAKYVERRRRFDKSGEYERVGSVSSVVDSSSLYAGSQSQLDAFLDDPLAIEDVTII